MNRPNSESSPSSSALLVCWTTAGSQVEAQTIAHALIEEGIASCVQIDEPTLSVYQWEGAVETSTEYRLWIKVLSARLDAAWERVSELHSYTTPQWIVMEASKVDEKYLIWAQETSNLRGFRKSEPIQ